VFHNQAVRVQDAHPTAIFERLGHFFFVFGFVEDGGVCGAVFGIALWLVPVECLEVVCKVDFDVLVHD
jgi:hypothetical protein